jgi:glycosyltransferase involved in cell wall biosynthesis
MTIDRAKVSVCMAAYQGEKYIAAQLQSILVQLSADDEVIVVDDHSLDGTCDQVRRLRDSRIRLIERSANQGVAKSFEEALSHTTGSVIFLSDQDDLWDAEKVRTVIEALESNPRVTLVATDAALIDQDGKPLGSSYYAWRGSFRSGFFSNLVRNKFLGCTMTFRAALLPKILPIPGGGDILHDIWIGAVNSVTSGATLYIDKPLVFYRRHVNSLTVGKLTRVRQLRIRVELLRAVMSFWIKARLRGRVGAPVAS